MNNGTMLCAALACALIGSPALGQGRQGRLAPPDITMRGFGKSFHLSVEADGVANTTVKIKELSTDVATVVLNGGFTGGAMQVGDMPFFFVATTDASASASNGVHGRIALVQVTTSGGAPTGLQAIGHTDLPGRDPAAVYLVPAANAIAFTDVLSTALYAAPFSGAVLPAPNQFFEVANAVTWQSADALLTSMPTVGLDGITKWLSCLEPRHFRLIGASGVTLAEEGSSWLRPMNRSSLNAVGGWAFQYGSYANTSYEVYDQSGQHLLLGGFTGAANGVTSLPALSSVLAAPHAHDFVRLRMAGAPGDQMLHVEFRWGRPVGGASVQMGAILPLRSCRVGEKSFPTCRMRATAGPVTVWQNIGWQDPNTGSFPISWVGDIALLDTNQGAIRVWQGDGAEVWGTYCQDIVVPADSRLAGSSLLSQYVVAHGNTYYVSDVSLIGIKPAAGSSVASPSQQSAGVAAWRQSIGVAAYPAAAVAASLIGR